MRSQTDSNQEFDNNCRRRKKHYNVGALNKWLRKSPAEPWKSFARAQQREAQLKVVEKDREEIGTTTILHSRWTPTEIRRRQPERKPFSGQPEWHGSSDTHQFPTAFITIRISAKPKSITFVQIMHRRQRKTTILWKSSTNGLRTHQRNSQERPPHYTRRLERQGCAWFLWTMGGNSGTLWRGRN